MSQIQVLPPEEAMKIAAGEVIDRPCALVREFLDNALDADSSNIELSIEEGGIKKVEVIDDGSGMSRENLELCSLTHATSKIRCLDDLETVSTLGFRGEALAAAAAVSRLEIITSTDGREAWKLEKLSDSVFKIEQTRRTKGTTVRALSLFETIPARKKFLKREGSEASLCRQVFIDKALAFPQINFRYVQDGKLKDFFPAVSSNKERFAAAVLSGKNNFLPEAALQVHEIKVSGEGFTALIVIGDPELYRTDRRQMYIFANGRRINDYALVQAMDYGCQGWFPNGTHPLGAVFVEIDPSLADFNIHPAKREVRFRDHGAIHQAVSGGLRNFFHSHFLNSSRGGTAAQREFNEEISHRGTEAQREKREFIFSYNKHSSDYNTIKKIKTSILDITRNKKENDEFSDNAQSAVPPCLRENSSKNNPRYAGRVFDLFIMIEWGEKLYIIDQHAAHERILYNKFISQPIPKQELLAPIPFTTESKEEDNFLKTKREELSRLGVDIEEDTSARNGNWKITALPAAWRLTDTQTVEKILSLSKEGIGMTEKWAASLCCQSAVKDGDLLDEETAFNLCMEALELPEPRCPHGRPIWTEIGKSALLKAVRRE